MTNTQQIIKDSKFIPEMKKILFEDCFAQLEGTFGISKFGNFESLSNLPNIKEGTESFEIRKKLEKYVTHKKESGVALKEAVVNFVKEYAFTYLNRFVAFKMMEGRKILRQTVSRDFDSNSFKFYLADHAEEEKRWKQGNVYEAYKNFICWQCRELCKDNEIKVLFDPDNIVSQIFPQERTLKHIFKLINQEKLAHIWKEDEVIGWVYQYFIEDDKEKVFDKIYRQKLKMDLTDIAPATQIFTPRWIVQYLVENTLGRLWIRMHPGTRLKEKMKYYVPNENDKELIPLKLAKEITLLDPACGTMHFGMVAFDLFYEMYLEEIENAGKDAWPESPSCKKEALIPASIIENNLYGIDIDLRPIQLSALSLYLKAKSKCKEILIERYNLVHTDIPAFSDKAINEFIGSLSPKYELTKKLFKLVMPELTKAYYLGSLLKIEDIINSFLEKQYTMLSKKFGKQMHFAFAIKKEQEEILFKKELVWSEVKEELRHALNEFIEQANGDRDPFMAQESKRGVNLIDTLIKGYDVVVCNPPYSGKRNMNSALKEDLTNLYPKKNGDLYTVFIDRCLDLTLNGNGFCGIVTIHSFMFTSSYEQIRKDIIENTTVETLCHLGTRTEFDVANKTAQGFAMYSLYKSLKKKDTSKGVYFRLVLENEEEKRITFEDALSKYISGHNSDKVYVLEQEKLKTIPGWPFVYWVSDKIRETFQISLLEDIAKPCQGIATADNARFLRLWWEVGIENIYFNCKSHDEAKSSLTKWFPYMKGGKVNRWFGNQEYIINWQYGGKELYDFTPKAVVRNPGYYFLEGATYSFLTVSNLSVRYLPHGFVFDVIGSSIFPKKIDVYCLLGILNSKMASYLIKIISPTIAYQVGDIARIPFPDQIKYPELIERIKKLVKECIELKKEDTKNDEISWEFISPPHWTTGIIEMLEHEKKLAIFESEISEAVYKLYDITQEDIDQIESEFGRLPGQFPKINNLNGDELKIIKSLYLEKHVPSEIIKQNKESSDEESEKTKDLKRESTNRKGRSKRFLTLEEICLASGFHPETVYEYVKANNLERKEERFGLAVQYISYALGVVMGRFEVNGIKPDDDGITVMDEGHSDDTIARVRNVLYKILNEKEAKEVIDVIGGNLRRFLMNDFFIKYHIPMYKKRPVYWLLQAAKKNYGFYIYNLKLNQDTLYSLIQKYIVPRINLEKLRLKDAHNKYETVKIPKVKREMEKIIAKSEEFLEELRAFKQDIQEVIDTGFKPDIDDGVILSMAPLYKLILWKEPEKYYKDLQMGRYEWAHVSSYFKK